MVFSLKNKEYSERLTKYPIGSLREMASIAFPLILSILSINLLGWFDRYFLSLYSIDHWKASIAATNLTFFFQANLVSIAFVTQAFIGHYKGSKQDKMIGPFTWQMLYFSFFSILITYPLNIIISGPYLKGIELEEAALLYCRYLSAANFLFPLGATLESFYVGRGKTRIIVILNIMLQVVNILLDYLLIFGIKGIFLPMGIKGSAIATIASQSLFCLILFTLFLKKKYVFLYSTNDRRVNLPLFLKGFKTIIPRIFGRCMAMGAYGFASYFLIQQGSDYFLIYSFGTTLFGLLWFFGDGIAQSVITITSYYLGANGGKIFYKIERNAFVFLAIFLVILGIPLLLMQEKIIYLIIKTPLNPNTMSLLKNCCVWIWIGCFTTGLSRIGGGFLIASRDTGFFAFCSIVTWATVFLPVYIGMKVFFWTPEKYFMIDSINTLIIGLVFIYRFFKDPYKKLSAEKILNPNSKEKQLSN